MRNIFIKLLPLLIILCSMNGYSQVDTIYYNGFEHITPIEAESASTIVVDLQQSGINPGTTVASLVGGGSEFQATIVDNTIRIATPSDTGNEQNLIIQFSNLQELPINILPSISSSFIAVEENDPESNEEFIAPPIVVNGIGQFNQIGDSFINISADQYPILDENLSSAELRLSNDLSIDLSNFWEFNEGDNSFTVSEENMASILSSVQGSADLIINMVSDDLSVTGLYEKRVLLPSSVIRGQLIDSDGNPINNLAGQYISLKGAASFVRRNTQVLNDGTFEFTHLVPDTYKITIVDLDQPNFFSTSLAVFADSTIVDVEMTYEPLGSLKSSPKNVYIKNDVKQNAVTKLKARSNKNSSNKMLGCGENANFYSIQSATQNITQNCLINFSQSNSQVQQFDVSLKVFSSEFPTFTQDADNPFDDRWEYSLLFSNASEVVTLAESGRVNQTHRNTGLLETRMCITKSDANLPITINGSLQATNIGDSAVPTGISLEINEGCDSELVVNSAKISPKNSQNYLVIKPRNVSVTSNIAGNYISIPQTSSENAWGLSIDAEYSPKGIAIDEIFIDVINVNGVLGSTGNIKNLATVDETNGLIKFRDFIFPVTPINTNGDVGFSLRLKAVVNGDMQMTNQQINLSFKNNVNFSPLTLAEGSIAGRRYGQSTIDLGDDNWAINSSIQWLSARSYWYNDISALHMAQNSHGHSVLGHKGHSDGRQLDLRFINPQGGFSDFHGGLIDAMFNEAINEHENSITNGSGVQNLVNWINHNRSAIESESNNARVIYIGKGRIASALVKGQFPSTGAMIPGVSAWNAPSVLKVVSGHSAHWHISLK